MNPPKVCEFNCFPYLSSFTIQDETNSSPASEGGHEKEMTTSIISSNTPDNDNNNIQNDDKGKNSVGNH